MKLTGLIITLIALLYAPVVGAQSDYQMKANSSEVDVTFLGSYYQQDGDNSAVEGGIGSEKLTDIASMIIVNVPLDSIQSISLTGGADYYTSASTDQINNRRSSASSKDIRIYGSLAYNRKLLNRGMTLGARLGYSQEYDYTSINGGLQFTVEWNQGNTQLGLNAQAFIDQWKTYYPVELRGEVRVPTKRRSSYNLQFVLSQVINKKVQLAFSGEAIYMNGLLSTPFHRVYFADSDQHDIERLPSSRLKLPFSIRVNAFVTDGLILRSYYRYYQDDFGILAHTGELELPIKVNEAIRLNPFVRLHTQTAADYFAPFQTHLSGQRYYTSDFDLSALGSQKYGLGIQIHPVYGFAKAGILGRSLRFKSIDIRGAYYQRSTGLKGAIISLQLNLTL